MRQFFSRFKFIFAAFAFVLTTALSSGGAVFAYSGGDNGNNPGGNNGTVKIDGLDVDDNNDAHGNDPHVGCTFAVKFFNYDATTINATVSFALQNPTAEGRTLIVASGNLTPVFTGTGPGGDLQHTENYTLAFTGEPQANQGYHVKMTVTAPFSKGNDTKTKVFWVGPCQQDTLETIPAPVAPTATEPNCIIRDMTVTPLAQAGVVWSPVGTTTLQIGESIIYYASPAQGKAFPAGATTSWSFFNDFNTSDCGNCGCNNTVTPDVVHYSDACGLENDTYEIPDTAHVKYYVDNSEIPASHGIHHVKRVGKVTIRAVADEGWTLVGGTYEWNPEFTDLPCLTSVKPKRVKFHDKCGTENDTYTIPTKRGVEYQIDGQTVKAGTYPGSGTVTVTAVAKDGYVLEGKTTWTHTFTDDPCGGHGGSSITPGAVTFADITCEASGSYTIPATEGVVYKDANGNVLAAGTYQVTTAQTVTIIAYPANETDTLTGTQQWSHTFTIPTCETGGGNGGGYVLGESTEQPAGRGGEVAGELVNTGTNTLATTILSLLVVSSALALYAYRPKVEQN